MNTRKSLLTALAMLAVGVAIGWWLNDRAGEGSQASDPPAADGEVLYWYDPMKPEVRFDEPGPSPFMDMALVPKYAASRDEDGISISPRVTQNLGVRTAPARQTTLAPRVTVTGTVAFDERGLAVVTTRAAGWLERLDVRAAGDTVRRGQRLGALYSPDLLAAQEEYLLALRADDQALQAAARRRLELLGVTSGQLARIASGNAPERQVEIVAPLTGVVTELLVREGAALKAGMPIVNLADLSRVWVLAEVPEAQGTWLRAGQPAEVTLADPRALPVQGRLDYLYPALSPTTRTTRVRIIVPNDELALRPGMTARVVIAGDSRPAVVVPTEALIRSGERTVVILAKGEGQFIPVAVETGTEEGEETEIRRGLKAGEQVVVSAQFLIDSEANLRGALDRLLPGEPQ